MKKIGLTKLRLNEFKGGTMEIDFSTTTNIYGANKAGKTRLFDAFTWLLFGKNSQGESTFDIKTLDSKNNPKHKLSHEVEAWLMINDTPLTLKRVYKEKWTTPRGSGTEVFSGHETTLFINDVPVSVSEYQQSISDLCPEKQFKLITNPLAFPLLHWEEQRKMLFSMAGEIVPTEICATNPTFLALIKRLDNTEVKRYADMLRIKKSKISEQLELIDPKIDENRKMMPPVKDWLKLVQQIAEKKDEINKLEQRREHALKAQDAELREHLERGRKIQELKLRLQQIRNEQEMEGMSGYQKSLQEYNDAYNEYLNLSSTIRTQISHYESAQGEVPALNEKLAKLREEWRTINAETFNSEETICPTCKQSLPVDEADSLREKFNLKKAERLADNQKKGLETKARIEELQKIGKPEAPIFAYAPPQKPEFTFVPSEESIKAEKEIEKLSAEQPVQQEDDGLLQKIDALREELKALESESKDKERIEEHEARIKELESEKKKLAQEKAELEKEEDILTDYNKFMIEFVEGKVSSLFRTVKFKLFNKQINGGEDPTCEAMIDGVPFSGLNNAGKVQAGLDIIYALQNASQIYAPIWIDNRESTTDIPDMDCQIINLYVSPEHKTLTIK